MNLFISNSALNLQSPFGNGMEREEYTKINLSGVSRTRSVAKRAARRSEAYAGVAQLVEHDLAKVGVASSSLVSRSVLTVNGWMLMVIS